MYERIGSFEARAPQHKTLGDLFRNIKKERLVKGSDAGGFQTALEVLKQEEVKEEAEQVEEPAGGFTSALKAYQQQKQEVKADEVTDTNSGQELKENKVTDVEEEMTMNKNKDLRSLFGDDSDTDDKDLKGKKRKVEDDKGSEKKRRRHNEENNGEKKVADSKKPKRLKKTEIGGLVVKLLTPAYVERRFESRDVFKSTARNISHALVDKGKYSYIEYTVLINTIYFLDEKEIKEYVESFLSKNEAITSQTKLWHHKTPNYVTLK